MKKIVLSLISCFYIAVSFSQTDYHLSINEIGFSHQKKWIELYNYGEVSISLESAYLSDDLTQVLKWKIKDVDSIGAKQYLIIIVDTLLFESDYIYLNFKNRGISVYVDEFKYKNRGGATYCKIPEGSGRVYRTTKSTPLAKNTIRNFLTFSVSPTIALGVNTAKFNQTDSDIKVKPGLYNSLGGDVNFYLWERYNMKFGLNYANFAYTYSSNSRINSSVDTYAYRINVFDGKEKTRWVDIKLPLLYNIVRVHDKLFAEAGFLISTQVKNDLKYNQEVKYYTKQNELLYSFENNYDSETDSEGEEFSVNFPLLLKLTYLHHNNWEFFGQYYLRKDQDDESKSENRNKKYMLSVGAAYNFKVFKIRKLFR